MAGYNPEFQYPTTRYSGSKRKFLDWIWECVSDIKFSTSLDVFGGTGSVSLLLKSKGKEVYYNDILTFNQIIGTAIIENSNYVVTEQELDQLFIFNTQETAQTIQKNYSGIFFTDEENMWLDGFINNLHQLENKYKRSIILAALFQACLSKRPYNLFHRANLNMRTADVYRNFGNKTTWEKSFVTLIKKFVFEYNNAVFDNGRKNKVVGGYNALACPNGVNLVYIDPPYFASNRSVGLDYLQYYNFLEGIANYNEWDTLIVNKTSKIPMLKENSAIKDFIDKKEISNSIEKLIKRFQDNIIVLSYLDNGIPSKEEIISMLKKYGKRVKISERPHKYALSKENKKELLFIAK